MSRAVVRIAWDHVPHLDEEQKKEILRSVPPYQRKARSQGFPYLEAGAIYPIDDELLEVDPFALPDHWLRGYGMDVGWKATPAAFMAYDPDSTIWYLYDIYYGQEADPSVHAAAIRARGKWLEGEIDPAANGRSQIDGQQVIKLYREAGLTIHNADNTVEAGIYMVHSLMVTGRFKVFKTCRKFFEEKSTYRRNEKGVVVKENDHVMDCVRYRITGGHRGMKAVPVKRETIVGPDRANYGSLSTSWMS